MKELEKEFSGKGEVKGFIFKLKIRNRIASIYEVSQKNYTDVYYEIFKRKFTPTCIDFKNKIFDPTVLKEIYPKAKDFGIWAWTTPNWEKAVSIFNSINE